VIRSGERNCCRPSSEPWARLSLPFGELTSNWADFFSKHLAELWHPICSKEFE
jgi:hypothetical protein